MIEDNKKEYVGYNHNFPQHLCKMCGKCCKAITTPYTHEELIKYAQEGQDEAKVFTEIFKPYPSIEDARKAVPDHVEQILNQLKKVTPDYDESKITFYYCPHQTEDNKCSIHATRPDCCRRAPRNGWSLFPPDCGFKGWQFRQREKVKQSVRIIKEAIIELETFDIDSKYLDTEMTVRERINYLNQKIKPWEKYGGSVW